jgi:putative membrane protein
VATPTLRHAAWLRDGRWYRLHPLTPVLQGGLAIAGIVGFLVATMWEALFVGFLLDIAKVDPDEIAETESLVRVLEWAVSFWGVVALLAMVGVGVIWLQWRLHVVRMSDDVIEVKKGVLFRSSRRLRLDRINAVGVRRPLIPRLLGLAKLDIQAAGNDASLVLAYLPKATAEEVRREIMEPSSTDASDSEVGELVTREVEVPLFRYLASLVVSVESIIFVAGLLAASIASIRSGELVTWLSVIVVVIVYVAYLADRFFRVGSFVVDTVDKDIRVSLGLLATSVETIPPGRIHALQLSQPWPWRALGWWRLEANLASTPGAQVSKAPSHTILLPVATLSEVMRVVAKCIPNLDGDQATEALVSSLSNTHLEWIASNPSLTVSIGSPQRARYRIPLSYRVNGGALLFDVILLRTGTWIRKLSVMPLARVQSSSISVGPWHQALRLGLFALQGVEGPVSTRIPALDRVALEEWWLEVQKGIIKAIAKPRSAQKRRAVKRGTS